MRLGTAGAPTRPRAQYMLEDLAVVGSQLVYNSNDANGKADIAWVDLAKGTTPTAIVTQADEEFLLGPARDKVVYTYAAGGTSDGLWIAPLPGTPGGAPITCTPVGAMSFHPVAGGSGSCTPAQVSLYDDDCISTLTASSTSCLNAASDVGTTCFDCLDTPVTSTSWGVVLENAAAGIDQLNTGGCFEKQGSTACAQASELQLECENNVQGAQDEQDGLRRLRRDRGYVDLRVLRDQRLDPLRPRRLVRMRFRPERDVRVAVPRLRADHVRVTRARATSRTRA